MFSYRHIYHAGNFADVVKHSVVALLVEALRRKETPFCVLDTHAAIGRYDLASAQAQQTGEFRGGIARIWPDRAAAPPAARPYLEAVQALNRDGTLRYYPGSPRLLRHALRPQDRLVLTELNPHDLRALDEEFAGDGQVTVQLQDAYQALKAYLPPSERRGLVLIDPAYELKDEYERLIAGLRAGYQRWPTGIYAIWYPIQTRSLVTRLHDAVRSTGIRKILAVELGIQPETDRTRLNGTGLLIINPPWQLDDRLAELLPWLHQRLAVASPSEWSVNWVTPE